MEDGPNEIIPNVDDDINHLKNGIVSPIMANCPEGGTIINDNKTITTTTETIITKNDNDNVPKLNGDTNIDDNIENNDDDEDSNCSSESDALVIDENVIVPQQQQQKLKRKRKSVAKSIESSPQHQPQPPQEEQEQEQEEQQQQQQLEEPQQQQQQIEEELLQRQQELNDLIPQHFNPFFNESLFELTQQHHSVIVDDEQTSGELTQQQKFHKHKLLKKNSPKLREYAQYLGLQPTVQFRCSRCNRSGFTSLTSLNEHIVQCNDEPPSLTSGGISNQQHQQQLNDNTSSFKLTRKVFLCSACGTYYENWNLYLHMIEVHRRYLCLYCLGMFSVLDDLCLHIQTKHNFEPGHKETLQDFYNTYRDPCYIVCVDCGKLFSEQDNFFYHTCAKKEQQINTNNNNKLSSSGSAAGGKNINNNNKVINNKLLNKVTKQQIRPEDHITGDSISDKTTTKQLVNGESNLNINDSSRRRLHDNLVSSSCDAIDSNDQERNLMINLIQQQQQQQQQIVEQPPPPPSGGQDKPYEIVYTSDSELDFKGFDENGEAVHLSTSTTITDNSLNSSSELSKEVMDDNNDDNNKDIIDEEEEDDDDNEEEEEEHDGNNEEDEEEKPVETRKVPKLSLKLKPGSFPEIEKHCNNRGDSDDEEGDDDDEDGRGGGAEEEEQTKNYHNNEEESKQQEIEDDGAIASTSTNLINNKNDDDDDGNSNNKIEDTNDEIQIAGPDVPIIELKLEQPLDKFDIKLLLQKCLNATAPTCIYCNHARKIAVNGKRLGLHAIAQHRYSAVVSSITAEELIPESFVTRIKESLTNLDNVYFNLESNPSDEAVTFSHIFECFQCRYATTIHKELYLHNRKSHAKNLLLCIMCKLNFYSYSELICHLCPGAYIIDYDVQFRCCMCISDDLPSAFRLMVHLRKRHHVCDVCLEMCHNQYKLSSHVWKHKLHHFCYRCGIAYRNKPDITRHLFWKHGTESVLCKKCLQKKWPHVYHFCVPPTTFQCDECNNTFTRAVALKVHKRLHNDDKPHSCTFDNCTEKFISKKLLVKHENKHLEPQQPPPSSVNTEDTKTINPDENQDEHEQKIDVDTIDDKPPTLEEKKEIKPKIDVYDLPELNLSESDSSDSENEEQQKPSTSTSTTVVDSTSQNLEITEKENIECENVLDDNKIDEIIDNNTTEETNLVVPENIWDDFKNYQANKEKFDNLLIEAEKSESQPSPIVIEEEPLTLERALLDHDYCVDPEHKPDVTFTEVKPDLSQSVDHDYCTAKTNDNNDNEKDIDNKDNNKIDEIKQQQQSPKKRSNSTSSSSSSDSDGSSCSCGDNCSCSSSSDSSSSTSDSSDSDSSTEEGRKRQQIRRDKRRQRSNNNKTESQQKPEISNINNTTPAAAAAAAAATTEQLNVISETSIHESDLETTESETDEEFYDKQPQLLAKKILEEKRNQLLAGIESTPNGVLEPMETSRPPTPNIPIGEEEEIKPKKKSKSKKKKKRKNERKDIENKEIHNTTNIPNIYNQFYHHQQQQPTVAPITLSLSRNSPAPSPKLLQTNKNNDIDITTSQQQQRDDNDLNLRASKRRRVPNKFYGYSSDEDETPTTAPKYRKTTDNLSLLPPPPPPVVQQQPPSSQFIVPPITIKTTQQPTIPPFSIRPTSHPGQMKIHKKMPPIKLKTPKNQIDDESENESNDSSNEGRNMLQVDPDALYCYCKCPYDEVSEMIGCDARDCSIEWFHFECVGIMVPPKGHWYCPECRKKRQQKREMLKLKAKQQQST